MIVEVLMVCLSGLTALRMVLDYRRDEHVSRTRGDRLEKRQAELETATRDALAKASQAEGLAAKVDELENIIQASMLRKR